MLLGGAGERSAVCLANPLLQTRYTHRIEETGFFCFDTLQIEQVKVNDPSIGARCHGR